MPGSEVSIGRLPTSDIVLQDPNVSRRHARIVDVRGTWTLEDLGTNGPMYVNGKTVVDRAALYVGDTISITGHVLLVREGPERPHRQDAEGASERADARGRRLVLLVAEGVHEGALGWVFPPEKQEVSIGRVPPADVLLQSDAVARRHARAYQEAGVWVIENLGAGGPMYVNDEPVQRAPLHDGDRIWLGGVTLIVREA